MHFPLVIDSNKRSLVHYIIQRENIILLKMLLAKISKIDDSKAIASVVQRADIHFCIQRKNFLLLEILFKIMHKNGLKPYSPPTKLLKTLTKKELMRLQAIRQIFHT